MIFFRFSFFSLIFCSYFFSFSNQFQHSWHSCCLYVLFFFFLFQCLAYFVSIPFFFFRAVITSVSLNFFSNILSFLISYIGYSTQQNRIAYFIYELIFIWKWLFAICIPKLWQLWTTSWKTYRSKNEIDLILWIIFVTNPIECFEIYLMNSIFDYNNLADFSLQRTRWKMVE